ncbi:MAG: glycosyltransferase [Bacteroidota bacterium]
MRAALFSIGTRGDIEPFLAVAEILKAKNWEVICIFPEQFRELTESLGYPFHGFNKEFLELLEGEEAKKFMGGRGSILQRIGYLIKMSRKSIRLNGEMIRFQHQLQEILAPDRIIYHPKCLTALLYGMAHPGKTMMLSPVPGIAHPVRHINILGKSNRFFNVLLANVSNWAKAIMVKQFSKSFRTAYPSIKLSIGGIRRQMLEKETTLYATSQALFPKPVYWPECAKVVGYHERDKTVSWQPHDSLTAFLDKHEKVVFITFGSMTNTNPRQKTQIILDVLEKHRIAAIINTSWGGLEEMETNTDHIHFVKNIPYDWIFSRVYAVVHHGGSGSTHTALKYGCPSLLIPHILDQFMWRIIVADQGLGPESISIKKLNHLVFEDRLLDLLNNPIYLQNTHHLSQQMKLESDRERYYQLILNNQD